MSDSEPEKNQPPIQKEVEGKASTERSVSGGEGASASGASASGASGKDQDHEDEDAGDDDEGEEEEENDDDDEQEDEEEEDEEEEDDDRKRGSGRKRRKMQNQFLDVEAEDDDEEDDLSGDEDGLQGEDGFVQEKADGEAAEPSSRVYRQVDRSQDNFTDADAQKLAERYRERYGRTAATKYGSGGAGSNNVPQQLLLPSVNDPQIFGINTRIGREKEAVKAILRKQLSLQFTSRSQPVFSAFQRDGFPGRIYVEAQSEAAAIQVVSGIPNIFSQSKILKVPISEYADMFRVVKKQETELVPGKYVRVKRGKYAGDLAAVIDLSDNGLEVRLKLVPRLDYGRTTSVTGATVGTEKRKRSERPPQRLFSSSEAGTHDPQNLQPHGSNAWSYRGDDYVKGYLNKDFKIGMLEVDDVRPSLAEIAKFQTNSEDSNIDLASLGEELKRSAAQSTAFAEGERVEVVQGEQAGLQGRVVSANGHDNIVTIRGDRDPYRGLEVSVPAAQLRKHFAVGDHVRVIRGNYKDDTGLVVSSSKGQVTLLSDASRSEITVFARDLRAASDTTVQNQLAGFSIQDLVQVNAQTVGCIIDVERENVRVLTQDAQIVTLKPEAIAMKLRAGGQRSATDARGREVSVGDTVKEISGEHRQGTIIHVYHQFVFMHNRERTENLGVFVNRVSQIAMVSTKGGREKVDLTQMNPAAQAAQPVVKPAVKAAHFNTNKVIGQKVSIGPGSGYKGLKGIIRDANETMARIELEARNKVVTVDIQKLLFTSPVTKQLVSLREFMNPYGGQRRNGGAGFGSGPGGFAQTPRTRWSGGKTPSGAATPSWNAPTGGRTPAWNASHGGRTPAWGSDSSMTPSVNSGGRTPAWNSSSGRTPAWNASSGKTPAWNADSGKTPAWSADSGKTPAWSADSGRTPARAGGRTPAWSASSDGWDSRSGGDFFFSEQSAPTPGAAPTPGVAPTPGPSSFDDDDDEDEVKYEDE